MYLILPIGHDNLASFSCILLDFVLHAANSPTSFWTNSIIVKKKLMANLSGKASLISPCGHNKLPSFPFFHLKKLENLVFYPKLNFWAGP